MGTCDACFTCVHFCLNVTPWWTCRTAELEETVAELQDKLLEASAEVSAALFCVSAFCERVERFLIQQRKTTELIHTMGAALIASHAFRPLFVRLVI